MSSTNENKGAVNRYPLPGVATPILPADIANKAYVDAAGGAVLVVLGFGYTANRNISGNDFITLNNNIADNVTEANTHTEITRAFTLLEYSVTISVNAHGASVLIGVRDDGVTIDSITIGIGLTGTFTQTGVSDLIATGSDINMLVTTTDGGNLFITTGMVIFSV